MRILLLSILLALPIGCESYSIEKATADKQVILDAIAQIDAEIAKLPPEDPLRKSYEAKRGKLGKGLAAVDAVLSGAGQGDFSGLSAFGAYGSIVGLALTLGWKWKQSRDRANQVKNVVASVTAADLTDEQKAKLAESQNATGVRPVVQGVLTKLSAGA